MRKNAPREATPEAVREIIAQHAGGDTKPDALKEEGTLGDLGIDSLGTVDLFWDLEDAFAVNLPDLECSPFVTVGKVLALCMPPKEKT